MTYYLEKQKNSVEMEQAELDSGHLYWRLLYPLCSAKPGDFRILEKWYVTCKSNFTSGKWH